MFKIQASTTLLLSFLFSFLFLFVHLICLHDGMECLILPCWSAVAVLLHSLQTPRKEAVSCLSRIRSIDTKQGNNEDTRMLSTRHSVAKVSSVR